MFTQTCRALFLLTMITAVLSPKTTLGCMCGFSQVPAKNMRELAAQKNSVTVIFEGTVESQRVESGPIGPPTGALSMTSYGTHRVVAIRIARSYRGEVRSIATVFTGIGQGDCGFDFETGKEYLVYAESVGGTLLFTSICTGTAPLEHAGPALRLLRGQPPTEDDLSDPESYYEKFMPKWTGSVCGRVTKPDGTPLGKAEVDVSEVREKPLTPNIASDPNLSKPDGSFCITYVRPGKYLLTAQDYDYGARTRWMGYYPGVTKPSDATPLEIKPGGNLANVEFSVHRESLYTVRLRIVTSDGSPPPWKNLAVTVDSPERDELALHIDRDVSEDGSCTLNLVPPGHYSASAYIQPTFETGDAPPQVTKWKSDQKEINVMGDMEVVLKLIPAN
jgi:hypothetical protein